MSTSTPPASPRKHLLFRILRLGGLLILAGLVLVSLSLWWSYRRSHSISEDAFVEAHIINVAPQTVSGRLVRFSVEENDCVEQDQVLAEIDATPYQDQVDIAKSKVDIARAELRRQEATLAQLRREVPIRIEMARHASAAAQADESRAKEAVKLAEDEVEKPSTRLKPEALPSPGRFRLARRRHSEHV